MPIGASKVLFPIYHPNFYEVFLVDGGENANPYVRVSLINASDEASVHERMGAGLAPIGKKYGALLGPRDTAENRNYTVALLEPRRSLDRIINERYDLVEFLNPTQHGRYAGCTNFAKFYHDHMGGSATPIRQTFLPEAFKNYLIGLWRPFIKRQLLLVTPEVT